MIILTGYNGFIGSHFLRVLEEELRAPTKCVEQKDSWKFLSSFQDWDKVTMIIHQGAISSTTEKDIQKIHHSNVAFTLMLFDYAIKYQIPVKYASSASVYGNQTKKLKCINPLNYYAISKLQIDYFVLDNIKKFKSIQGFRYFNVYGSGEGHKGDQASPISKFTQQIRDTGKLKLFEGSDKFYRDFVYVGDVVDVVLNNGCGSGIYDIGTGNPISFKEVAELVAKKEGGEIELVPFPEHLNGKYQTYTCADTSWYDHDYISVKQYLQELT